jgi:hypothetical protein
MLDSNPWNMTPNQKHNALNNMGENGFYLCMILMMLCTHKNIKLKHHMNMFTNINIYIGNPSITMTI